MLWIPHRSRGESCGPDETEAKVVLQVFREFADGTALKKIASMLNEKAIPAPNDGGRGNKRGRGWGHTTIRAMLSNERYIGRSTWNQSKWVRVPGRKGRRRVMRPESEWIKHDVPELAIVPPNLWKEVQERFTRACAKGPGRPAGTGQHVHLVSGLMRCGTCGGSMTIVRRKTKAGVAYSNFGCTAHYSRGAAICPNALSISERKASRTLVHALKEKLDRPDVFDRFVSTFEQQVASLRDGNHGGPDDADRRVRECERRIANLTESLAKVGWSESLGHKLREEETVLVG